MILGCTHDYQLMNGSECCQLMTPIYGSRGKCYKTKQSIQRRSVLFFDFAFILKYSKDDEVGTLSRVIFAVTIYSNS